MNRSFALTLAAGVCALSLCGCVDSDGPVLPNAKPLLGKDLQLQFYTLRQGFVDEPEQASFRWDGERYVHTAGSMNDVNSFTVHKLEGRTYIVQSAAAKRPNIIEYAVARELTEGVYQVIAIDENDADITTRQQQCRRVGNSYCRITTRKQLNAFAHATGAKQKPAGGLVLRLATGSEGGR